MPKIPTLISMLLEVCLFCYWDNIECYQFLLLGNCFGALFQGVDPGFDDDFGDDDGWEPLFIWWNVYYVY